MPDTAGPASPATNSAAATPPDASPPAGLQAVEIEVAKTVTPDLCAAAARLIPQLSQTAPPATAAELGEIIESAGSTLFLARASVSTEATQTVTIASHGEIVGMLTLVTYRIPTGMHAVIEDVVVDESARGSGAGAALVAAALGHAESIGVKNVDLTSRPSREAANRLYIRMGFEERATNVYRHARK